MIPFRDTMEVRGPVWATVAVIAVNFVLYLADQIPHLNFWQFLVALYGLWLFGAFIERRLGSVAFIGIYLVLAVASGFLEASVDDVEGLVTVSLFLPVVVLGVIHLALAPRSRILALVPIPFAMTFFEIPTAAVLVGWIALEVLLTAV